MTQERRRFMVCFANRPSYSMVDLSSWLTVLYCKTVLNRLDRESSHKGPRMVHIQNSWPENPISFRPWIPYWSITSDNLIFSSSGILASWSQTCDFLIVFIVKIAQNKPKNILLYISLEFLNFSANQNIFTNDESSMSPKVGVAKVQPAGTVTIIHILSDNF